MPSSGNLRTSLLFALALACAPAWAAERAGGERLRELGEQATGLQKKNDDIRRNFTERSGLIGVTEARERYEDAVYLFLVKDYEAAATSFYILVQSRALGNADLSRDSEWYLAECLFELGNYSVAEEAYRSIAEKGNQHPYFADSIRRLLEVYGILGDTERFDRYYNDFIVTGKVPTTELISYTLAKSFYRRAEFNRSKAMFETLPPTSPYYGRARYFLGVLMLREKNYPQAIEEYKKVVALAPADEDQQKVLEQAQIALARLYYETGDFGQSAAWYDKVGGESNLFADKLYESVWTYVKQANSSKTPEEARTWYADALKQAGIFLDKYPEHRYAADLRILRGHLNMKLLAYEDARTSYEQVVDEYTPLIERLEGISSSTELRRLLEGSTGGEGAGSEKLPDFAMGALLADEDVARAAGAWRTLEDQRAELSQAERIVQDLEVALSGNTNVLGAFVTARQEVAQLRGASLSLRDQMLDSEATWLKSRVPSQYKPEIVAIQKERSAILASVAEIDASAEASSDRAQVYEEQVTEVQNRAFRLTQLAQKSRDEASAIAEMASRSKLSSQEADKVRTALAAEQKELESVLSELDSIQSEVTRKRLMRAVEAPTLSEDETRRKALIERYSTLRLKLQTYRGYVTDADAIGLYAEADRVWAQAEALDRSTDETGHILANAEGRELAAVRSRLARESQRVQELRRDLDRQAADAEALALKAIRIGVRRLAGEFREDVLIADKGIVDVYWLRKTAATDKMDELGEEQVRLLQELDDQFRIVRENLDR